MNRERLRPILSLAVPIVGGMASQNVLNLVDTAMVGTLGSTALAAVGIASIANFVSVAFLQGLSAGVQAIAARRFGEGKVGEAALPLNAGLMLSLGLGVPVAALLFWLAPTLFPFLKDDPAVVELAVPYWRARLVAVAAVAINFSFRGYWNGVNKSRLYLNTLVIMHATNIFLNYVLIFGKLGFPAMGTTGAGIGTAASTFVGTLTYIVLALRHARPAGFLRGVPPRVVFASVIRLSVPNGLQQFAFAAGFLALQWIIGRVGTVELAAATVLLNLTLVALLPGLGLGLAAASLVGQALGRGDPDDAARWGWDVVKVAAVVMALLGLPMLIVPDWLLMGFLHDPEALAVARLPLRLVGGGIAVDAVGMVLSNALLGAGASRRVMAISVTLQWVIYLPIAFLVGPTLGYGLIGIWIAQLGHRIARATAFAASWQGGAWKKISV